MRLLATIPHYFAAGSGAASDGRAHGSLGPDPGARIEALSHAIAALHRLFGPAQVLIDHARGLGRPANGALAGPVDVVVCTTRGRHLLDRLPLPPGLFLHHATEAEPMLLGFECQAVLRERIGAYDYYGYLEDDLILRDPLFFAKLAWFNAPTGDRALLQPNRYEVGPLGPVHRAYLDGAIAEPLTAPYQDVRVDPVRHARVLDQAIVFRRPSNPHSGCYFLNAAQMAHWAKQPYFLDRDTSFIGPLESAATLGVMRAFRIYKPDPPHAGFLEVEHHGHAFLARLRRRDEAPAGA